MIRSDGKFIRDYFYVEDAAEAMVALAQKISPRLYGEAFNFSNETPLSVMGIVAKILKAMDSGLKPVIQSEATNEIYRQYLSAKKARSVLGWRPKFNVAEGLKRTIAWYRNFFRE